MARMRVKLAVAEFGRLGCAVATAGRETRRTARKKRLRADNHADSNMCRAVCEDQTEGTKETRGRSPVEDAVPGVPVRADREVAASRAEELMGAREAARRAQRDPFALLYFDRSDAGSVRHHDLRKLAVAARHEQLRIRPALVGPCSFRLQAELSVRG